MNSRIRMSYLHRRLRTTPHTAGSRDSTWSAARPRRIPSLRVTVSGYPVALGGGDPGGASNAIPGSRPLLPHRDRGRDRLGVRRGGGRRRSRNAGDCGGRPAAHRHRPGQRRGGVHRSGDQLRGHVGDLVRRARRVRVGDPVRGLRGARHDRHVHRSRDEPGRPHPERQCDGDRHGQCRASPGPDLAQRPRPARPAGRRLRAPARELRAADAAGPPPGRLSRPHRRRTRDRHRAARRATRARDLARRIDPLGATPGRRRRPVDHGARRGGRHRHDRRIARPLGGRRHAGRRRWHHRTQGLGGPPGDVARPEPGRWTGRRAVRDRRHSARRVGRRLRLRDLGRRRIPRPGCRSGGVALRPPHRDVPRVRHDRREGGPRVRLPRGGHVPGGHHGDRQRHADRGPDGRGRPQVPLHAGPGDPLPADRRRPLPRGCGERRDPGPRPLAQPGLRRRRRLLDRAPRRLRAARLRVGGRGQ